MEEKQTYRSTPITIEKVERLQKRNKVLEVENRRLAIVNHQYKNENFHLWNELAECQQSKGRVKELLKKELRYSFRERIALSAAAFAAGIYSLIHIMG